MARSCEVCGAKSGPGTPARLKRFLLAERLVLLCDEHAAVYRAAAPTTLTELRALFRETWGKRSLIGRRATLDRRLFPARPEGRRLGRGRRATDVDD